MNYDNSHHLDEDQLLQAVLDEANLPQPAREHLSTCPQCETNKGIIEKDLMRLGHMVEKFSPSPRKRVSLPAQKPRRSLLWSWEWRTAFGLAVVAALVIFVVKVPILFKNTIGEQDDMYTEEMLEAERFMAEVSMFEENALPTAYMSILGESDQVLDEEFIEFLVPTIKDEPFSHDSHHSGKKGGEPC